MEAVNHGLIACYLEAVRSSSEIGPRVIWAGDLKEIHAALVPADGNSVRAKPGEVSERRVQRYTHRISKEAGPELIPMAGAPRRRHVPDVPNLNLVQNRKVVLFAALSLRNY
jgi:hypothetical protein